MYVSIATTHVPATDLGYLLMKHPDRVHAVSLSFGRATVIYPEATETRCEAVLVLDVDPIGLVRGQGRGEGLLADYVNDRPYAATSFLAVALNRAFRTAMTGQSRDRPELAATPIPLTIQVTPLPAPADVITQFFAPLGWSVDAAPIAGAGGYHAVTLAQTIPLSDALTQLYVLIPALDAQKHYWVGDDEIEKLLGRAGPWLATHPAKETITRRYLKRQGALVRSALAQLLPEAAVDLAPDMAASGEEVLEAPLKLNDIRHQTIHDTLVDLAAWRVADLGCGEGRLLQRLAADRRFTKIYGLDAAMRDLGWAARRLELDRAGASERITLLHGALTYRDTRWADVDAACLVEVIEHLDLDRLPALEAVVFGAARPRAVIVSTPNVEHNVRFVGMAPGQLRHLDHRFEWTRAEFHAWADGVASHHGYRVRYQAIGADDPAVGPPTQMAVFER